MNRTARIAVIAVLVLAAAAVLVLRGRGGKGARQGVPVAELVSQRQNEQAAQGEAKEISTEEASGESVPVQTPPPLPKGTVATVNGRAISEDYLRTTFESLPAQYKQEFQGDMEAFLDQLIVRDLLLHEAKRRGLGVVDSSGGENQDGTIQALINALGSAVQVSDQEARRFYAEHAEEVQGATFEQVEKSIRDYLGQQKFVASVSSLIDSLRSAAKIVKSEEWLAAQRAALPPDPLEPALRSGKPTVLDLGSDTCVPCKMMKPILAELEKEYHGKANILVLDVYQHRRLAREYQVRVIPTQVFFDRQGEAYWRHEGFMSKEEIVSKLRELGVE
ncbi:MAG: thioredoxin domain-containing protein [candidate division KSB1 bacterium]|nr:thioredoxin domain-containing protein [candidate division KSB1 bacterium]MDZ7293887.1 thioredoxin domain-containing protein [candidate division KSB1 bacterium]MDZ7384713.1 thioredoxin domain-containing protein [candidate division KSB1 bacterium]MDZ7392282.1 thioredoxin domain-containing protein [candidate division KSB1 bacterium]